MIECKFRTGQQCQLIDAGVGLPIIIEDNVCDFCTKNYPDEDARSHSYAVLNLIYAERQHRGLKNEGPVPTFDKKPRQPRPEPKRDPKSLIVAPVLPIAECLATCQKCRYWKGTRQDPEPKCRKWCNCTDLDRADPRDPNSEPCPIDLWRHE